MRTFYNVNNNNMTLTLIKYSVGVSYTHQQIYIVILRSSMPNIQNIRIYTSSGERPTSSVGVCSCYLRSSAGCLQRGACKRAKVWCVKRVRVWIQCPCEKKAQIPFYMLWGLGYSERKGSLTPRVDIPWVRSGALPRVLARISQGCCAPLRRDTG